MAQNQGIRENFEHYLFKMQDYEQAWSILSSALEKNPDMNISKELHWCIGINPGYLCYCLNYAQALARDYTDIFDLKENDSIDNQMQWLKESLPQNISSIISGAILGSVLGDSLYNMQNYTVKSEYDRIKIDELVIKRDNASTDREANGYQKQINRILNSYDIDLWEYNYNYLVLADINNLPNLAKEASKHYCDFLDGLYTIFLDRAKLLHHANFLKAKYPTEAQKSKIRSQLENKIMQTLKEGFVNFSTLQRLDREAKALYKELQALEEATSDDKIVEKGVMSGLIGLISGPAGIINGIREASKYNDAKNRKEKVDNELQTVCENFADEHFTMCDNLIEATNSLDEAFEKAIKNFLIPAIIDVLQTLKKNNCQLKPLQYYFMQ